MNIVDYRLHLDAHYLGSVLTEAEAKEEVARLTKLHPEFANTGQRYGYTKYVRRAYTDYEERTGLPDWTKEDMEDT